jgi:hypothetical protein
VKLLVFLIFIAATSARAELAKDCDSACRYDIFLIESEHFPLRSFKPDNRQAAVRYVADRAVNSNSLWVKLRALEALNSNASSIHPETRAVTLNAIKSIAAGSGDSMVEDKAVEMIGRSLNSRNPGIVSLAEDLIAQIRQPALTSKLRVPVKVLARLPY